MGDIMRSRVRHPPQGSFDFNDVIEGLKKIGALNKKYDSDLDGIIDLTVIPNIPDYMLDFGFAWEKVARVQQYNVSSIEFINLSGDNDIFYLLVGSVLNEGTAGTGGIFSRYNGDTTVANYGFIAWENDGGTVSSQTQQLGGTLGTAGCIVTYLHGASEGILLCLIKASGIYNITTGNNYALQVSMGFDTNAVRYTNAGGVYKRSADITQISLFTGAGVNVNWDVTLFKPKW